MVDTIFTYFSHIGFINISVLVVLSIYLILTFWIFLYKYFFLKNSISKESDVLESLLVKNTIDPLSDIGSFVQNKPITKNILNAYEINVIKDKSSGISTLSIFASTAPFIGLFGTVVGILNSFSKFATLKKVGFSVIAPAISEALVATAAGIFVAIFAYTFHQILVRKLYELNTIIKTQIDIITDKD